MSWSCFTRCSTRAGWKTARGARSISKNTVIILTSNVGTDLIMKVCADEETIPAPPALAEMLRPEMLKHFKPAFLGRLKVVPYFPITDRNMRRIIELKLNRVAKRMRENRNVAFIYDPALVDSIAQRCTEVASGARNVDHIMTNTLLPEMSRELLSRMAGGEQINQIKVRIQVTSSSLTCSKSSRQLMNDSLPDTGPFRLDRCADLSPLRRALEDAGYTQSAVAATVGMDAASGKLCEPEVALRAHGCECRLTTP